MFIKSAESTFANVVVKQPHQKLGKLSIYPIFVNSLKTPLKNIFVCPITKQDLLPVDRRLKSLLDKAQRDKRLIYADGCTVPERVTFWVTKNKTTVYSVLDGVPILLEAKQVLVPESG